MTCALWRRARVYGLTSLDTTAPSVHRTAGAAPRRGSRVTRVTETRRWRFISFAGDRFKFFIPHSAHFTRPVGAVSGARPAAPTRLLRGCAIVCARRASAGRLHLPTRPTPLQSTHKSTQCIQLHPQAHITRSLARSPRAQSRLLAGNTPPICAVSACMSPSPIGALDERTVSREADRLVPSGAVAWPGTISRRSRQ